MIAGGSVTLAAGTGTFTTTLSKIDAVFVTQRDATPVPVSPGFSVSGGEVTVTTPTLTKVIPLSDIRTVGTNAPLGASAGTPTSALGITPGTHGTASPVIVAAAASGASVTNVGRLQFALPETYEAGGTITLTAHARTSVAAAAVGSTLDVQAFLVDGEAGIGSDLCTTDAADINSTDWDDFDFTITPTGLVAGDVLDIELTVVCNDTGETNGSIAQIGKLTATFGGGAGTYDVIAIGI